LYGGKQWNSHEANWSVTEQEIAGIIYAIESNSSMFTGRKFYVETDHLSNVAIQRLRHCHGKLYRWALRLHNYSFDISHISGNKMPADYLSRTVDRVDKTAKNLDDDSDLVFVAIEPDIVDSGTRVPRPLIRHPFARTHRQGTVIHLPMFDTSTAEGPTSHNGMDKIPPDVQRKDQCTSSSAVAPHNVSHDHVTCHLPDDGRDRQQSYKSPGEPTLESPQARDGHPDFDLTAGIAVSHMHMTNQRAHTESTGASCSIQSPARVPTTPSVLVNTLTDNDSQMPHDGTTVKMIRGP